MEILEHENNPTASGQRSDRDHEGGDIPLDALEVQHADPRLHRRLEPDRQKMSEVRVGLFPCIAEQFAQSPLERLAHLRFAGRCVHSY